MNDDPASAPADDHEDEVDQTTHEAIEELRRGQRRNRRAWMAALVVIVLAWAMPAFSMTTVPYVFSPGTPARAGEINANFSALASAIDALDAAHAARLDALETRDDFVPAGTIAFFTETACPTGWTEYGPADGRYVVAVTGGKTVPGPVGDPLANMGNPTHTHTIAHRHEWARYDATTHEWFSYSSAVAGSARVEIYDHSDGLNGEGSGFFPLSTTRNGPHYTGDPTVGASGSASTSAIAPYIQLRACRKD